MTMPLIHVHLLLPARDLQACREILQPCTQLTTEIVALGGELNDHLDVLDPFAGVITSKTEDRADYSRTVLICGEFLQRIRQLDLATLARLSTLENRKDRRGQHVASDDGKVRRCILLRGFLDEASDAHDVVVACRFDRGCAVEVDLRR